MITTRDFPNGFTSWMETFYEMTSYIALETNKEGTLPYIINEEQGMGGMYSLAETLTDEFEKKYMGFPWDGDFYDVIEEFVKNFDRALIPAY